MYTMSRLILLIGALAMLYWMALLALIVAGFSPLIGILVAVALLLRLCRGGRNFTSFGTARWCSPRELQRAAMIGGSRGLILGRLPLGKGRILRAIGRLLNGRIAAKEACQRFFAMLLKGPKREPGELVRMPNAVHSVAFCPTGGGKGVSCVVPFLRTCEDSCVVLDFKGENALLSADWRRRMGHEIVVLDPFKMVTQ